MVSKGFSSLVAVCLLALSGCTSGMYTSKVYVDKEDNGVSDYAVVSSLDVKEYTQSMPVVMESSYKTEKYENDLNVLLWGITLGIVPGFSTETRTYDVTVKTPIGEKSGKGYVKASKWLGWIPLFLPYPGIADERSDCAQLPHAGLEKKVQDKLVANLVSQFSKEEYSSFVEEWKKKEAERKRLEAERAEAERIRLEKERIQREKEEAERKRLEAERAEAERIRLEKERIQREKEEAERKRLEAERAEAERKRIEADRKRFEALLAEAERVRREKEAERAEKERIRREKEEAERKRLEAERAEAERIRREKEAAERAERNRLARRVRLIENKVEKDLAAIRKCYADGERYLNPFLGDDRSRDEDRRVDWLSKWSESRLPLSEAEALEGNALLSEFAEKYLPNAYANYEKKREALLVLQQVFNEEFPEPWRIKESDPKWNSFNKVLENFVKARAEYFLRRDELCHYWHMHRFGVLSAEDFAQIDAKPLAVSLLAEYQAEYVFGKVNLFGEKERNFAIKFAPESNALYQKIEREFNQLDALIKEVIVVRRKMDSVRESGVLLLAIEKRNLLCGRMNDLSKSLMSWYYDHRTMEKTSDDVAKLDNEESKKLKLFINEMALYVKEKALDIERNGLSVQLWAGGPYWATTNIGAEGPWDQGYYFWWGDTVGYKRENYKWVASDGSNSDFSFSGGNTQTYNKSISILQSEGWITSDGVLAPEYDAATVHCGNGWRMPTREEIINLNEKCDWIWTRMNGVCGYIARGREAYQSNSIFFPCTDRGLGGAYWGASPSLHHSESSSSLYLWGGSGTKHSMKDDYYIRRYEMYHIRPVRD